MEDQHILEQFRRIKTWQSRGTRAPHKPLLMLLALGEIQRGNLSFISHELKMLVSDEVNGQGADMWLIQHHGKVIKPPQKKAFYPNPDFTAWHVNEVFKGGYRE